MSDYQNLEEENYTEADGVDVVQKESALEKEYTQQKKRAKNVVSHLTAADELPKVDAYVPQTLSGALFCGPVLTNLDCVAGAIGAAELYGGIPARATEVNPETEYALKLWGAKKPRPIEELLVGHSKAGVCLVDHQQTSMLSPSIEVARIVGVIDHHALHNATIVTDMPIYIDIRPWGSVSTIVTHNFLMLKRRPSKVRCKSCM
ncbi:hypothetical protein EON65_50310 [archaeon]|nr:MAG: hypothetical protein EON65_50310 [archaeon]